MVHVRTNRKLVSPAADVDEERRGLNAAQALRVH